MARKRLSDTAAVPRAGEALPHRTSLEVDVRRISNGYVTRESKYSDKGYQCTETFSEGFPGPKGAEHGPNETRNSLAEAVGYLKGTN